VLIHLSRDSVAAGDDVQSHDRDLEVDGRRTVLAVVGEVVRQLYLPRVGAGVAWVVRARRQGRALAFVVQNFSAWDAVEPLVSPGTEIAAIGDVLHFQYLTSREAATQLGTLHSE
jgi:hypothetical protein